MKKFFKKLVDWAIGPYTPDPVFDRVPEGETTLLYPSMARDTRGPIRVFLESEIARWKIKPVESELDAIERELTPNISWIQHGDGNLDVLFQCIYNRFNPPPFKAPSSRKRRPVSSIPYWRKAA